MLNLDKVLNEELIKFTAERNKHTQFRLNNISTDIELTKMSIELLQKDSNLSNDSSKYKSYLEELNLKFKDLTQVKTTLQNALSENIIDSSIIDIMRNKLKYFISNFRTESLYKQNLLLKELTNLLHTIL
jgi:aspartyl-tRNA synthetase